MQDNFGDLEIELTDAKGTPCIRLMIDSTGNLMAKAGYRNKSLAKYKANEKLDIRIVLNTSTCFYSVTVNGKNTGNNLLFAPVLSVERITFRTGSVRRFPDADTPTDQSYDLPNAGEQLKDAMKNIFYDYDKDPTRAKTLTLYFKFW